MSKYNHGKIYKLTSSQTEKVYIGSTINTISQRLSQHKYHYKLYMVGKYPYMTSFELCKYDDCEIKIVRRYQCDSREELESKEGIFIKKYHKKGFGVNKHITGQEPKEVKQKHTRRCKKEYQKEYQEANKDRLREYKNQKFTCECGGIYSPCHKSRHIKTLKHMSFVESLP